MKTLVITSIAQTPTELMVNTFKIAQVYSKQIIKFYYILILTLTHRKNLKKVFFVLILRMKKIIVCTTINSPTEAIEKYDEMSDWHLVVVGDQKTPKNYSLKNGLYLSPEDQIKMSSELSDLIGWNCIQRRNFGLLHSFNLGADIICTVDDDNIPLDNWGKELLINSKVTLKQYNVTDIAFDPIGSTNYKNLWHRGFPLELIPNRKYDNKSNIEIIPDIQADFWNGDPDIDALCRLEHKPECKFEDGYFPFTSNKFSPFNSQNTFINRKAAMDYFLFPHIGRMDDIWAAYYVLSKGHKVVYNKATVYQNRNVHNLIDDMKKEYIGYENNLSLLSDLYVNPDSILKYLPERSIFAWNAYRSLLK